MPPTLILIRHAQAQHNATSDWSIRDPPLTELGEQQSRELHESLKASKIGNEVELIVVSAQRRTLQTATIGLDWLIKKGTKGKIVFSDHHLSHLCNMSINARDSHPQRGLARKCRQAL
jgi:broad specificity phosphatase PhoE